MTTEDPISWRVVRKNSARLALLTERVTVLEGKVAALQAQAAGTPVTPVPPPADTPGKGKGKGK